MSKSIEQSNIITQELETIEKTTFFAENQLLSKNYCKIIKVHKTTKLYYSRIKKQIYTESKVSDCTVQLSIIKKHILPKK